MELISSFFAAVIAGILGLFGAQPAPTPTTTPTVNAVTATPSNVQTVIFKGTSPCADCSGIDIVLTLIYNGKNNISGNYTQSFSYQGKPQGNYSDTGTWTGGLPNDVIELTPSGKNSQKQYYQQTQADALQALGANQQQLPPPYNYTLVAGE